MPTTSFTMRMDTKLKQSLEEIAKQEDRSVAYIANRAIERMIEQRESLQDKLARALEEITAGVGIPSAKMQSWMDAWGEGRDDPFPQPEKIDP